MAHAEQVLKLLRRKERWLAVAAIRFLRTCLNLKDEFYNRYLVLTCLHMCSLPPASCCSTCCWSSCLKCPGSDSYALSSAMSDWPPAARACITSLAVST